MLIRYNECMIRWPPYSSHSQPQSTRTCLNLLPYVKKFIARWLTKIAGLPATATTKRITILRFFITNIKRTHIFMAFSALVDAFGTCFFATRLITQMSPPNERSAAFWVAQKYSAAATASQPELMSLNADCSRRCTMGQKSVQEEFMFINNNKIKHNLYMRVMRLVFLCFI